MGADDEAYHCVFQQEDSDGIKGVKLDRVSAGPPLQALRLMKQLAASGAYCSDASQGDCIRLENEACGTVAARDCDVHSLHSRPGPDSPASLLRSAFEFCRRWCG